MLATAIPTVSRVSAGFNVQTQRNDKKDASTQSDLQGNKFICLICEKNILYRKKNFFVLAINDYISSDTQQQHQSEFQHIKGM